MNEENEEEGKNCELPLYNPAVSRKKDFIECPYNLRPRNRKTVNSQAVFISMRLKTNHSFVSVIIVKS